MLVVPVSFGAFLTVVVVGLVVLSLIMLPSWVETWLTRSWTKRTLMKSRQPPVGQSNLERFPGIYGKDHF